MSGRVLGSNKGGRGGQGGGCGGGPASSPALTATPAAGGAAAPAASALFSERLLHAHRPPLKRSSLSKFYASKSKSFSCMAALLDGEAPSGSWLLGKGKAAAAAAAAGQHQHEQPQQRQPAAPLSPFAEEWPASSQACATVVGGGSCDFDCAEVADLQLHLTTVAPVGAGGGCCGPQQPPPPSPLMPLGRSSAPAVCPAPARPAAAAAWGDDATPPPETPRAAELASQASLGSSGDGGGGGRRGPVDMLCSALRGASLAAPA